MPGGPSCTQQSPLIDTHTHTQPLTSAMKEAMASTGEPGPKKGYSSAVYYFAGATGALTAALLPFMVVPWLPMRRFGALPYMHTPRKKLDLLFQELLSRHGAAAKASSPRAPPPKRFIDLGSGLGEAVIEAHKHGFEAQGVELNPTLFLMSSLNALRQAGPLAFVQQPRLGFALANMWSVQLQDYDVIMAYGVQSSMARLTQKMANEAKHGAVVVLYRFRLDLPVAEARVGGGRRPGVGGDGKEEGDRSKVPMTDAVIRLEETAEELAIYKVYRESKEKA